MNDWANTLARITALEAMAGAIRGLTSSVIDNIMGEPNAEYDEFISGTQDRLTSLESLAAALRGVTSSVIDNINRSDLGS